MIKSMTGYGRSRFEGDDYDVLVEVKTLNSKYLDINLKMPRLFNDREIEIKSLVKQELERGKVSVVLELVDKGAAISGLQVNESLFLAYYDQLKKLADSVSATPGDLFKIAIENPSVVKSEEIDSETGEKVWQSTLQTIKEAIQHCNQFREQEGNALKNDLLQNIDRIRQKDEEVKQHVPRRNQAVKNRLRSQLDELIEKDKVDENRFEQELIYYIEKFDINEEQVRLANHLNYFINAVKEDSSGGKKLGFIAQEIGREINTMGSKANDATIQHLVVGMKEELEKVKEQIANIV